MRKMLLALMSLLLFFGMTGCGSKADFDASGYVEGVLDAQYHQEYARHAEDTGATEEEVRRNMEGTLIDTARIEIGSSGLQATEEEIQEYVRTIQEGYRKVEFTVGEAKKDEKDNYVVEVKVKPVGFLEGLQDVFSAKLREAVDNGATEDEYMGIFIESVKEGVANAKIYDEETLMLHVRWASDKKGNHIYSISDEEVTQLENVAIHLN